MVKSLLLHLNLGFLKPHDSSTPPSLPLSPFKTLDFSPRFPPFPKSISATGDNISIQETPFHIHDESPVSIELNPICSEIEFDNVISDSQQRNEPVIILWMASWCRKCIYLKPKLERLAADYYPRLQFYCVDVNVVSHKLVARAGVAKMPTIQLWKDGEKQDEVIGAHKAYLVSNEVRKMIESEFTCE